MGSEASSQKNKTSTDRTKSLQSTSNDNAAINKVHNDSPNSGKQSIDRIVETNFTKTILENGLHNVTEVITVSDRSESMLSQALEITPQEEEEVVTMQN